MMIGPTTPKTDQLRYAVDNGAFPCFVKRKPWDEGAFLKTLDRVEEFKRRPDFAVCPDIVAAGERSLEFSLSWMDRLPAAYPWYLAVQDGMTDELVLQALPRFGGLFIGGSSEWKMRTMAQWTRLGHGAGKKVHVGRVNTPPRAFVAMKVCGVDSFDGNNWNRTWKYAGPKDIVENSQGALNLWGLR